MFWSNACSLLRAVCFSCSLDFLYGRLGVSKMQFLIPKNLIFPIFSQKPWIRILIGIQPKMMDPDQDTMNPDPKHWS
jgi:hypothetical protein